MKQKTLYIKSSPTFLGRQIFEFAQKLAVHLKQEFRSPALERKREKGKREKERLGEKFMSVWRAGKGRTQKQRKSQQEKEKI